DPSVGAPPTWPPADLFGVPVLFYPPGPVARRVRFHTKPSTIEAALLPGCETHPPPDTRNPPYPGPVRDLCAHQTRSVIPRQGCPDGGKVPLLQYGFRPPARPGYPAVHRPDIATERYDALH